MKKLALFRFEASPLIGAGHAIRSCVLADALIEQGWICKIVTTAETYEFIHGLNRFDRIEPEIFYKNPSCCDLLIVDNYELDQKYEKHFRSCAKKIMVIDDLANKKHDCDILLDQTYGRDANDYKTLVPEYCKVLAGSDYVLLRKEFIQLRSKALEKRHKTTEIKRILVSMGGSDPENYTLKVLEMIKQSGFSGAIDIVLGFASQNAEVIKNYINDLSNECSIYVNADMPKLMYEADLAIGAAGSSVWERCCLGLPQYLIQTADNQSLIINMLSYPDFKKFYDNCSVNYQKQNELILRAIDGLGTLRLVNYLAGNYDKLNRLVSHAKVREEDVDLIFNWQQNSEIRLYSFNKTSPSYEEHKNWFYKKINSLSVIFEKIIIDGKPCGTLRLDYCADSDSWKLSWYVMPEFQGRGIGFIAIGFAKKIVFGKTINAFVFKENSASHRVMNKAGFKVASEDQNGFCYAY